MKRQLTAAVLACAFALLVAPPAAADPQTDQYLAQLRAAGIGYASPTPPSSSATQYATHSASRSPTSG